MTDKLPDIVQNSQKLQTHGSLIEAVSDCPSRPVTPPLNQARQELVSHDGMWECESYYREVYYDALCRLFSHPNILRPEQELTVQVGSFYEVHVCHSDLAFISCAEANEGKVLQKFTTNSTSSNLEIRQ